MILGSISGLKNVSQIDQWATDDTVSGFLREKLKLAEPVSLNRCFNAWVRSMLPECMEGMTVSCRAVAS